jgi:hypothetical protein
LSQDCDRLGSCGVSGHFHLFPNADSSRYSMKREGEEWEANFTSFHEAFRHARSCQGVQEAKVVLHDVFGMETIRFSVNMPASQKRGRISPLDELAAIARRNIEKRGSFHLPQNWLWRCWELNLSRDAKQRKQEIEAFAGEHKWAVHMRVEHYGLSVDFTGPKASVCRMDGIEQEERS